MRIQLIGLGHVGKNLVELIDEKTELLKSRGLYIRMVSVSDSTGTIIDKEGLSPREILKYKPLKWQGCKKYVKDYSAQNAIRNVESDVVVELTPSTPSGQPGLSNIKTALTEKKNVVTANKGPLVVAYKELMKTAEENGVKLLHEATVGAHLPVFCLTESCFKIDETQSLKGILNATTNFIIGEMEKGKPYQEALDEAIRAGWSETDYSDDVDGIDAARKTVILANALFKENAKLKDVKIEGIRHIETLVKEAKRKNMKVKLVCEIKRDKNKLKMTVSPEQIAEDDPLVTVKQGNMGIAYTFKTSQEIFVSAQFLGPKQTAFAVLNDIAKLESKPCC